MILIRSHRVPDEDPILPVHPPQEIPVPEHEPAVEDPEPLPIPPVRDPPAHPQAQARTRQQRLFCSRLD